MDRMGVRNIARFIVFLLAVSSLLGQNLDDLVIAGKTEIFLTLQRTISTQTIQSGDKFFGQIAVPITYEDQIVIPVGSHVIGQVVIVKSPGRLKGQAELILGFDTIILPDGTTRKMEAIVQSAEGARTDPSDEMGTLTGSENQGQEAAAGAGRGAIAGGTIGAITDGSLLGLGLGAAVGSGVGALLGLFTKGDDVVLEKGTTLVIQLRNDIHFVKPRPATRGTPL